MAESAVVNASPLIFLSRARLIDQLQLISAEVIVPQSVATEIGVRGKRDPAAQALAKYFVACGYSNTSSTSSNSSLGIRTRRIFGLAWAHFHPGSEAIIDDLAVRRCAGALRIPVRGTGLTLMPSNVDTSLRCVEFWNSCVRAECNCPMRL